MALPNDKELQLLTKFRIMLADLELTDEERTDMFLVAWLRARDLDLNKANDMLRKSLQWRKEHDFANILKWDVPEILRTEFYYEITGQDADGVPVCVVPFGKWDIRKAVDGGRREEWLKHIDYIVGLLYAEQRVNSERLGRPVTQSVIIMDFDKFGMRQLTSLSNLNTILEFVRRFESNYPECLRAVYVVNATRVFMLLFRFVKPLLSDRTLSKVEIYGSNEEQWKKILRANIPADQLPVEMGGTQIAYGPKLRALEPRQSGASECEGEDFSHAIVRPGERFTVDHTVEESAIGAILSWRFKTVDYDIGFMILHEDEEQVHSYRRVDSHLLVHQDSVICEKSGKYSVVFDNVHSRFREKHLYYDTNVTLKEPN